MTQILLQNIHWMQIKAHVDSQPEREVCGLIGGFWKPYPQVAIAQSLQAIQNIDAQPETRFTMSPRQQLAAMLGFEQKGWQTIGIYHSHPQGKAEPSASDLAESFYPDVVYLIAVPQGEVKAWRIVQGQATPAQILF